MDLRFLFPVLGAVLLGQGTAAASAPPMPQPQMPQPQRPMMQPTMFPIATPMPTAMPTMSPAPAPPPPSGSAVLPRAKEWMLRVQTGEIDRSQLSSATNAALTASMARKLETDYGRLGRPVGFTFVNEQNLGNGNTAYNYRVRFKHATLMEKFVLDSAGKISGLSFTPVS
jgi:hypothetical protein